MGHEMGHYKLDHIQKLLLYLTLMALAGFLRHLRGRCRKLLARYGERWGVRDIADPRLGAGLLGAAGAARHCPAAILFNSIIRFHESEADAFGLEAAREPDGFAMTAMQLSEYRKIEPGGWRRALFFDHPSGRTRVRMAMEWKAQAPRRAAAGPARHHRHDAGRQGELGGVGRRRRLARGRLRAPTIPPSASSAPAMVSGVQR